MTADQRTTDTWPDLGLPVEFRTDVGRVQRLAASATAHQGFPPTRAQLVQRVAVDMATHLMTHDGTGRLTVRLADQGEHRGVELLLSTTHSAPAHLHLSDQVQPPDLFEVYPTPGKGTAITAQLWREPHTGLADRRFLVGSMSDPIDGETVSGDAWAVEEHDGRLVALVSDGLGHGAKAAAASAAAVATFRAHYREPVEHVAARLHEALRRTRGAAVALAAISDGELTFCGIGNVTARLVLADGAHQLLGRYGIAGYQTPRLQTTKRSWSDDAMLVMHTDGLSSRWDAGCYPHLRLQHPQLVAITVMRDAARAHDDALVIAVRSRTDG